MLVSILDEVNHRPESRMRETRTSGSEGGGAEINRLSLPLFEFVPFGEKRIGDRLLTQPRQRRLNG